MAEGDELRKDRLRAYVVGIAGVALIISAILLLLLLRVLQYEEVQMWYADIRAFLHDVELRILNIRDRRLFVLAILCLYTIKSVFPVISNGALCVLTGLVMPVYYSLPLNVLGLSIVFSMKYWIGRRYGAKTHALIRKNKKVLSVMEGKGKGNPWLLATFRFVPWIPLNTVSRLYGQMKFRYGRFLILSLLGFAPRLISYTFIGRNAYDPLSASFLTPIAGLLVLTGFSLISANAIWRFVERRRRRGQEKRNLEQSTQTAE